jgi:hypothetical protein
MALTYDASKCVKEACFLPKGHGTASHLTPTFHGLMLGTIVIGMPNLNEKTVEEFVWRMNFATRLNGVWSREIDAEFLKPFMGLSTNASKLTRNQFIKKNVETYDFLVRRGLTSITTTI